MSVNSMGMVTTLYNIEVPKNIFKRVQQWGVMARQWWLYDAYGQDVFRSALQVRPYLQGKHKPYYVALGDHGDHVVVVNAKHITMEHDLWERVEYYHHTGYPGGAVWTPAWKLHQENPTEMFRRNLRRKIKGNRLRDEYMARLHVYPELDVPEHIMKNVSAQIRQIQFVPKKLHEYSEEERNNFPRLFSYPKDFVIEGDVPTVMPVETPKKN
ncbi:39S ribosomal protein L13, mitochondrial-like [Paramacrobiotus metropolitanus]|uniref:39S ribosomal protein L13, mitochondrial-like n=1 Tax=Paramacrobiotus metropolitanus TaxID=2943436 RepID=UPI0024459C95|nr:39S ribosomal protein L13, mitochondrial-like [Paramacrobiotus metropolitanus]